MKNSVSILAVVGLVAAQHHCRPKQTLTVTEIEKVTVTVSSTTSHSSADPVHASPTHLPSHHPHYPFPNGTASATSFLTYTASAPATTLSTLPKPHSVTTLFMVPSPVGSPSDVADAGSSTSVTEPVAASAPETPPETVDSASVVTGKATSYGGNLAGGNCMFTGYTLPAGIFGTAFSGSAWNNGAQCGTCVSVTGPNGKPIKAMIVDKCPECEPSHLDLFADAYTAVSGQSPGIIPITYSVVPCGITTPLILKNKEGTSAYYFSMQVMNANVAVSKLEVSVDGGVTWKATQRQDYNFFENGKQGFGKDTVDVKVTSVDGKSIVIKAVSVASGSTKTAGGNFA